VELQQLATLATQTKEQTPVTAAQSEAPTTAAARGNVRPNAKVTTTTGNAPRNPHHDPELIAKEKFGPDNGQLKAVPIPKRKAPIVAASVPMTAISRAHTKKQRVQDSFLFPGRKESWTLFLVLFLVFS
jgi:hypothetical protein